MTRMFLEITIRFTNHTADRTAYPMAYPMAYPHFAFATIGLSPFPMMLVTTRCPCCCSPTRLWVCIPLYPRCAELCRTYWRLRIACHFSRPFPSALDCHLTLQAGQKHRGRPRLRCHHHPPRCRHLHLLACTGTAGSALILHEIHQLFTLPTSLKRYGHPGLEPRFHPARPCR